MSRTSALILGLTLAFAASADDLVSGLVRNAWYWQARARSDKAEDAWKQVLEAAPDNPEALAAVGGFHARAGRMQQAREVLARLEKTSPGHADVPVLRRQIELGPRYVTLLSQARKLVHEGQASEGAAKYRELFGAAGPPGDLALEYYQTVGGASGGWQEARDGLRRLLRRAPAEVRYKLALAKLLTYRDDTRREGANMLAQLARDPTIGKDASAGWRQALLWLSPEGRDVTLYRDWLRLHPRDTEVARHLERARNASTIKEGFTALDRGDTREAQRLFDLAGNDPDAARGRALIAGRRASLAKKSGFAALERGDLVAAESYFRSVPSDGDTRLGLALVAQKQAAEAQRKEDFAKARDLLERSRRLVPDRGDVWEKPLQSVVFWSRLHDARVAREEGRENDAEAALRAAIDGAGPQESWHARLALADLMAESGRLSEAEANLREVLSVVPEQANALRALAGLLVQQNRFEEAIPVNERLEKVAPRSAYRAGWLRAETLRTSALRNRQANDYAAARDLLKKAREADPSDVWVLHDLANVLLTTNAVAEAQEVVGALLRIAPELPEARLTHARLLVARHQDAQALAILRSLSPQIRDPAVAALRKRLEFQVRIPPALEMAQTGRLDEATRELAALESEARGQPELLAQLAVAWSKLGDRPRAVGLMRDAMARGPSATRGARLELASTLLDAGDDAFLGEILRGLEQDSSLTATERRSLGQLRVAHAVRLADRQRDAGDLRAAEAALAPALRDYPRDPLLLGGLARAREQGGDISAAHALYLDVLRGVPDDGDALRGAVDTALARGDLDEARALLSSVGTRRNDDPRIQQLAAHLAEREGDDGEAMKLLRRAATLARSEIFRSSQLTTQEGIGRNLSLEGAPQRAALADPEALHAQIARDMQRIENRHRPAIGGDFGYRQRQGESGLSALRELRGGGTVEVPVGFAGRLSLRISEVQLDAGPVAVTAAPRFGTGEGPAGPQRALGTELHAFYESRHFAADVGATPLGFPTLAAVGGVRLRGHLGPLFVSAEGSSRTVNESFVSMAAARDAATGTLWGGVLLQGGRLDLSLNGRMGSIYAYGEGGRLIGLRVLQNTRFAGGGGAELAFLAGPLGEFRLGPAFTALSFENNQRFFTFGHGGYFSPQRFAHGAAVFRWQRSGTLRWEAAAEPGYDWYQEAHAPILPLSPDGSFYPGRTAGGFSFNGRAFLGIGVGGGFELGVSGGLMQAPQFQEVRAGLVLRAGGL
jgi:cellulose synthase operon protein C